MERDTRSQTRSRAGSGRSAAGSRSAGGSRNTGNNRKRKKRLSRRQRQRRKIILVVVAFLLVLVFAAAAFIMQKYNKMGKVLIKEKDVKINDLAPETKEAMEGYDSIAIFGLDNRSTGNYESGNSDAIIIASINRETGEIKMASVYRDTYLDIGEGKFRKANAAYAQGGPKQAIEMLNRNLDLGITDYVSVDFSSLVEAIDLLGGIELDLESDEVGFMNDYIDATNQITNHNSGHVSAGQGVHVDGVQATAYSRIRYTTGWDYKRTERQRTVITKMFEKVKECDLLTLNSFLDEMLPQISTSLDATELLDLAKDLTKYHMGENTGFPFDKESGNVGSLGDMVIPVDMEKNVVQLHQFLYGSETYTPSETLKNLSSTMKANTGY